MANRYSQGFYTLMDEAGILSSKSFSLYIRDVVGFGNIQDLNLDGFSPIKEEALGQARQGRFPRRLRLET